MNKNQLYELAEICFDIFRGKLDSDSLNKRCTEFLTKYPYLELSRDQNNEITNFVDDIMSEFWETLVHIPKHHETVQVEYEYWENCPTFSFELKQNYLDAYMMQKCTDFDQFKALRIKSANLDFNCSIKKLRIKIDNLQRK